MNEWMNGIWVRALPSPMHLGLKTGPLCALLWTKLQEPCSFTKAPDGPYTQFPNILQGQKEGIQVCMPECLAQNVDWGSSSVPHFLQMGLLLNPIIYRCLLRVLCPVSRPITTLDWVLLKDNRRAPVARSGPELSVSKSYIIFSDTLQLPKSWYMLLEIFTYK
jgi:hypothetical protein